MDPARQNIVNIPQVQAPSANFLFSGIHKARMDNKGRFWLPVEFQKSAKKEFPTGEIPFRLVLNPDQSSIVGKLDTDETKLNFIQDPDLQALFNGIASMNAQGKILIPIRMRKELAGYTDNTDLYLVGKGEIFTENVWLSELEARQQHGWKKLTKLDPQP
jgi:DNA-binding transcriptional regulator/RsmH inhibitor MraZ